MNIIGGGGHAKVIAEILKSAPITVEGIWDDNPALKNLYGYPVLGTLTNFIQAGGSGKVIIGIGNNQVRKELAFKLSGFNFGSAIHNTAFIADTVSIGAGSVVMANASVNVDSSVGKHCILNTNCSVDHDCILSDFVHISPNAALAGQVTVGEGTHIGIGSSIIQGISVGKWVTIGAGTVVIRNIPDYAVVVGNPGRIIKYNHET